MTTAVANLGSTTPMRGDVFMTVRDAETGEILTKYTIKNTIVYNGLNSIIRLLAQNAGDPAAANLKIASLHVGTGTIAPTRADVALLGDVFTMALVDADRVESIATSQLVITKTLGAGDANGSTLTEAGLFLADGTLFARQIHPAIPKTNIITITYEWQISFTS
jgi:hypothetical protein